MERRTLGNSPLSIGPLMLGGNVFGWTIDEVTSSQVLDAFVGAAGGHRTDRERQQYQTDGGNDEVSRT